MGSDRKEVRTARFMLASIHIDTGYDWVVDRGLKRSFWRAVPLKAYLSLVWNHCWGVGRIFDTQIPQRLWWVERWKKQGLVWRKKDRFCRCCQTSCSTKLTESWSGEVIAFAAMLMTAWFSASRNGRRCAFVNPSLSLSRRSCFFNVSLKKTCVVRFNQVKYLGYAFYRNKGKCRLLRAS